MTIQDRLAKGEYLVPLQYDMHGINTCVVGSNYEFNYMTLKVIEVCHGDLEGYCWIKRNRYGEAS